jgi:SOS-response transcriptional repressor LexA
MNILTKRQFEIIEFIYKSQELGISPSLSTIGNKFGNLSKHTIKDHLDAIEKKGLISRNSKREIEIRLEFKEALAKMNDLQKNIFFNIDNVTSKSFFNANSKIKEVIDGSSLFSIPDKGEASRYSIIKYETNTNSESEKNYFTRHISDTSGTKQH